jgi:hypothetical protein
MRTALLIMLIFALPVLALGASEGARQVVLEASNIGQAPLEKTVSNTSQTNFTFRLAGVELSDKAVSATTYQQVSAITDTPEKFGQTDTQGLPDLPVYSQMVGIPDQAGVRVEIISSSYQIIENVDVYPFQRQPLDSRPDEVIPFTKDEAFYQQDAFYPSEVVQVQEPVILRDLRMVSTVICPIQYNPVRRELKVYTNIDWRLSYEGIDTRNQKIRRNNYISETFLPMYRALVPNADEMLASYQPIRGGYLILYPRQIPDSLVQVLANWKHLKGYSVVAVPDSAIAHNASPSATQIFNYIQNAYNTWEIPPEFVCIMGSIFVTNKIIDSPHDDLDSDHHYACVDGSDYFADVMVTRMSMPTTISVLRTTIWKAVVYDKTPYMGDPSYWLRGFSCAGNVSAVTPRLATLWVREMLLRRGFQQVDTVFYWDGHDPGIAGITAALNRGVSITSYRGWGFPDHWGAPVFSTSDLNALQFNNKIGPACCPTCGTGNFGSQNCFGETWCTMGSMTTGFKGGPGYFGACGEDTETRYDNPFMVGYYAAILMEGIHNFASACFMGKLELYDTFPFNRSPSAPWPSVCHYTYSFNPLGEPEFEVRTGIPQTMTVTYPDSIPVGTNLLMVHVVGSDSLPLDSAYVCLVKGRNPEEVFVGGRTNSNGDISLSFSTTVADTMFVTVTAYNYIPHCGHTLVQSKSVAVGVGSITIDDDNSGNSHGNSDGNVNPSETVEFSVTLRNFGTDSTAGNISATLTSLDSSITVTVANQTYGSIAPGDSATSGKFAVHFASDLVQGNRYILQLAIASNQGSWTAALPVDIKNMLLINQGLGYPGNANNRLDPGETSQLVISLKNMGQLGGIALSGILTSSDTSIVIVDGTADFGDIGIDAIGSNTASPFIIQAGRNVYRGHNSNFNLELVSSNGSIARVPLSLVIGAVNSSDPVGPDSYGYYLYDNTDVNYTACPAYNWVEISPYAGGSGTRVAFSFGTDDDSKVINSLPFNIRYYGETYSYLMVSINGFVAFDTTRYDGTHHWAPFDNNQIPEPSAPDGLIAPFWDDLEYTGNNGVFQYADTVNHRFILEWKSCTHTEAPGNHPETFEMIINDPAYYSTPTGDCEMVFQYQTVYNDDNDTYNNVKPGLYATVGMQDPDNFEGLEYTFDNVYHPAAARLVAGRAIKMTTTIGLQPPSHLVYSPSSYVETASTGQIVLDTLNISNAGGGLLNFTIGEFVNNGDSIKGDDQNHPPIIFNHGGPDSFGHNWVDSDDPGGPAYTWIDISEIGTPAAIVGDNGFAGPIDMGMNFSFYGTDYSSVFISANGLMTLTSGSTVSLNATIPNANVPNNFLAPLWDDLSPQNGGSVLYYHDAVNNRFIVSYTATPFYTTGGGTGSVNFETILYPNGRILYEYGYLDGGTHGLSSITVGIENSNGTDGLQVVYNASYLHSNMAILFYTQPTWLQSNIHGGSIAAGHDTIAVITFDATNLARGTYTGHLSLDSNDPDSCTISIPVTFYVDNGGPACNYVIGDVNGNRIFNGLDVVYAVRYITGGQPPPYSCECTPGNTWFVVGDVNASCGFNGLDVTYMVYYFRGGPDIQPCPDCPPSGLLVNPNPGATPVPTLQPKAVPSFNSNPKAGSVD